MSEHFRALRKSRPTDEKPRGSRPRGLDLMELLIRSAARLREQMNNTEGPSISTKRSFAWRVPQRPHMCVTTRGYLMLFLYAEPDFRRDVLFD